MDPNDFVNEFDLTDIFNFDNQNPSFYMNHPSFYNCNFNNVFSNSNFNPEAQIPFEQTENQHESEPTLPDLNLPPAATYDITELGINTSSNHTNNPSPCPTSNPRVPATDGRKRRRQRTIDTYKCYDCDILFSNQKTHDEHLWTIHGVHSHECLLCDEKFVWKRNYDQHLKSKKHVRLKLYQDSVGVNSAGSQHESAFFPDPAQEELRLELEKARNKIDELSEENRNLRRLYGQTRKMLEESLIRNGRDNPGVRRMI